MAGTVAILNVGSGDTKLVFDKNNPQECIRAARIVKDMLRRGYALLVEVEKKGEKAYQRVHDFDEKVCEYIIADFDPEIAAQADQEETEHGQSGEAKTGKTRGRRVVRRGIPADGAKAVAVARSAGG